MNKNYASFGQMKGLLWKNWYDNIIKWHKGKGNLLPPPGATIDPTYVCPLNCDWCNFAHMNNKNPRHILSKEHIFKLVDLLVEWGVLSCCYAGGGEPFVHESMADIIKYTHDKGLEVGISTNGVLLKTRDMEAMSKYARFCGISVDAGTQKTWCKAKGSSPAAWKMLMKNIKGFSSIIKKSNLNFTFKFMISPLNQNEILKACELARKLGFDTFFARPCAIENIPTFRGREEKIWFDVGLIEEQIERCEELEDKNFRVFLSKNRVNYQYKRTINFERCYATPLIAQFGADGNVYLCIDSRGRKDRTLCKHFEIRQVWGSRKHREMIESINMDTCPRCAFGNYNEQIEHYMLDTFYWKFP